MAIGRFSQTIRSRLGFRGRHLGRCRLTRQVDRGAVNAKVKAHGPDTEESIECGRQQVLSRMLLHVIEAADPIDDAVNTSADLRVSPVSTTCEIRPSSSSTTSTT